MANFSPVRGLEFCCDSMMNFSLGWNISHHLVSLKTQSLRMPKFTFQPKLKFYSDYILGFFRAENSSPVSQTGLKFQPRLFALVTYFCFLNLKHLAWWLFVDCSTQQWSIRCSQEQNRWRGSEKNSPRNHRKRKKGTWRKGQCFWFWHLNAESCNISNTRVWFHHISKHREESWQFDTQQNI